MTRQPSSIPVVKELKLFHTDGSVTSLTEVAGFKPSPEWAVVAHDESNLHYYGADGKLICTVVFTAPTAPTAPTASAVKN